MPSSDRPPSDRAPGKSLPSLASELFNLVRAYAKQETIEPIKGIGRYVAFGAIGSVLLGIGGILVLLAVLRLLQGELDDVFDRNLSVIPYLLTLALALVGIGLAASRIGAKGTKA